MTASAVELARCRWPVNFGNSTPVSAGVVLRRCLRAQSGLDFYGSLWPVSRPRDHPPRSRRWRLPAKKSNLEIPKLKRFSPSISSSAQPTIPVRRCRITTSLPIPEGRGIRPCDEYYRTITLSIITRERGRGGACATDLRLLSVRRKKVTKTIRTQAQARLSHGRVQRGQTVVEG